MLQSLHKEASGLKMLGKAGIFKVGASFIRFPSPWVGPCAGHHHHHHHTTHLMHGGGDDDDAILFGGSPTGPPLVRGA